ncbi:hypothetical protein AALO_G00001550 [Alosa alosa]|uniref:Uncharacterized protein n=1 Tax=Alosa alosa TaxID=278164 RepID=A0AAV6HDU0_9TELE|nr:hypothetical protein AALO_G00001550 [Alosa alosa]
MRTLNHYGDSPLSQKELKAKPRRTTPCGGLRARGRSPESLWFLSTATRNIAVKVMAIAEHRKRIALEGLPLYLREDPTSLFKKCLDTDAEEDYTKGVKIGILTVKEDGVAAVESLPAVINTAIILEETVVLQDIKDVPSAFYVFDGPCLCNQYAIPQKPQVYL